MCKGVKGDALPGRGVFGGVFFMGVCVKYYVLGGASVLFRMLEVA